MKTTKKFRKHAIRNVSKKCTLHTVVLASFHLPWLYALGSRPQIVEPTVQKSTTLISSASRREVRHAQEIATPILGARSAKLFSNTLIIVLSYIFDGERGTENNLKTFLCFNYIQLG
jgi:hypothetical protein